MTLVVCSILIDPAHLVIHALGGDDQGVSQMAYKTFNKRDGPLSS